MAFKQATDNTAFLISGLVLYGYYSRFLRGLEKRRFAVDFRIHAVIM